jgi:hypothetical protein
MTFGSTVKRGLRVAIKVVATTAGIAFVFSPVTNWNGLIVFASSIVVGLICAVIYYHLDGGDDEPSEAVK